MGLINAVMLVKLVARKSLVVQSFCSNSSLYQNLMQRKLEVRCVRRKYLLETLERALPHGTIRYSSKVDSLNQSGNFKLIHLSDGSVVRTKVDFELLSLFPNFS